MAPTPEGKDRPSNSGSRPRNDRSDQRTPRERSPQSRSGSAFSREFAEAVGRTIKVIRTDLGIERRELAQQVGISYSYLTEIENGNKPASSNVLGPIAHALGMRLSQLTDAAERRIASYDQAPDLMMEVNEIASPMRQHSLANAAPSAMRPSLRGQYHDIRGAILELERLVERMAPDDIERLLDYARRLSR